MNILKSIKKYLPDKKHLHSHKDLGGLGKRLLDPRLWHFNKYSVANGFSIGLFAALIPLPMQMLIAASMAVLFRGNLPLAVALTWITNPFTTPPLLYFNYKLGSILLSIEHTSKKISMTADFFSHELHQIVIPTVFGCIVLAIVSAVLAQIIIRLIWRISIQLAWHKRKKRPRRKVHSLEK